MLRDWFQKTLYTWLLISRQKVTIPEKVACRPIYELCADAERMPGTSQMMIWWDKDVLNKPDK